MNALWHFAETKQLSILRRLRMRKADEWRKWSALFPKDATFAKAAIRHIIHEVWPDDQIQTEIGRRPAFLLGLEGLPMRREFNRSTKRAAWLRSGGECEMMRDGVRCLAPLARGRFAYDHIDPDWFSGCNDLCNCQVICLPCHRDKTAKDQGNIAKTKRIIDKGIKAKTSRNPLPFGKRSHLKKKIGGGIVDRRTGRPL